MKMEVLEVAPALTLRQLQLRRSGALLVFGLLQNGGDGPSVLRVELQTNTHILFSDFALDILGWNLNTESLFFRVADY